MTLHLEPLNESKQDISSTLGALQMIFDHQSGSDIVALELMGVIIVFDFVNKEFYIDKEK